MLSASQDGKPRVLLVPNVANWILGDIGRELIRNFGHECDFAFVTENILYKKRSALRHLVAECDIVHALCETGAVRIGADFPTSEKPLVTWIHHVTRWSEAHVTAGRKSKVLVASTAEWGEAIRKHSPDVPMVIAGYGVDGARFMPRRPERSRFGIPESAFVIGFVASKGSDSDDGRKGLDAFRSAIEILKPSIPEMHIVFAGPGWEPEVARLRSMGVSASTTGYIREKIRALYPCFDAYFMTSRVEGGPCTVLEAMACGTAVVATRVGVVPELITDGHDGFSVAVGDVQSLAGAALALAAPATRLAISAAARETVLRQWTWQKRLAPVLKAYAMALSHSPRKIRHGSKPWNAEAFADAVRIADAAFIVIGQLRRRKMESGSALVLRELVRHSGAQTLMRAARLMLARDCIRLIET